jgi:hypothetical protein
VSIARPRPGPDAALVRVRAVGLCGSWLAVLAGTVTPEPLRRDGPGWAEFLRSQAQEIPALDFFTAAFDAVFQAAGARVVRSAIQAPRMNSIMERRIGSCRRELLDRTLVWNQRHLVTVLREYEDFYNYHRHRTLSQAAPLRPLPAGIANLDSFHVRRRDRAGGVIHETAWRHGFSVRTGLRASRLTRGQEIIDFKSNPT